MTAPLHAWAKHPLQAFRVETCYTDRDCWFRIWTCRNDGWGISDVSVRLGQRLVAALAERYGVTDWAGLFTGRVYFVR